MNTRSAALVLGSLLAVSATSFADVGFRVTVGNEARPRHVHAWGRPRSAPYYYAPSYRYPRPYRQVYVAPVVVAPQPVYLPVQTYPSGSASLSGNYGTDLANLNGRLSRLRAVLQRQNQKGQISSQQFNTLTDSLEGIEHDEHARAFDRGGNLAPEDFADLQRRLDQVGQDIELALAQ